MVGCFMLLSFLAGLLARSFVAEGRLLNVFVFILRSVLTMAAILSTWCRRMKYSLRQLKYVNGGGGFVDSATLVSIVAEG